MAEENVSTKSITDQPESEIPLIQEMLGYTCIAVNKAQKCFVLQGKKDSGKSTLLYVVQDVLLGAANVSNLPWQSLEDRFAKYQLFGKLANIFADLPSEKIRDTGTFKAITGEDYIMGERKHKDGFSFKPFASLLFSCNGIPKNYVDYSDAFYGRLIIILFALTIPKEKQDTDLKEKLMAEADGILAWAMLGLKRLMANRWQFSETERTNAELDKYRADNSSVVSFVQDCCEYDDKAEILREDLYAAYLEYSTSSGGPKPVGKTRFNSELDGLVGVQRGLEAVTRRKTWRGLRLT